MGIYYTSAYVPLPYILLIFLRFKKKLFIYFWLCWVFTAAQVLSPVAESKGYSLVAVYGLLIMVVSPVVQHGF